MSNPETQMINIYTKEKKRMWIVTSFLVANSGARTGSQLHVVSADHRVSDLPGGRHRHVCGSRGGRSVQHRRRMVVVSVMLLLRRRREVTGRQRRVLPRSPRPVRLNSGHRNQVLQTQRIVQRIHFTRIMILSLFSFFFLTTTVKYLNQIFGLHRKILSVLLSQLSDPTSITQMGSCLSHPTASAPPHSGLLPPKT